MKVPILRVMSTGIAEGQEFSIHAVEFDSGGKLVAYSGIPFTLYWRVGDDPRDIVDAVAAAIKQPVLPLETIQFRAENMPLHWFYRRKP